MLFEPEEGESLLHGGRKFRKLVTCGCVKSRLPSAKLGNIAKKFSKQSVEGACLLHLNAHTKMGEKKQFEGKTNKYKGIRTG